MGQKKSDPTTYFSENNYEQHFVIVILSSFTSVYDRQIPFIEVTTINLIHR